MIEGGHMAKPLTHRLPALLAAAAAASALAATPALATEGPPAPAPGLIAPPAVSPFPTAPARVIKHAPARVIKRARIGSKGVLKIRLAKPSRLRVTVSHGGHRVRTINVKAGRRTVSLRPTRHLRPGHYHVRIVAIDGQGVRSRAIDRTVTMKPRARR